MPGIKRKIFKKKNDISVLQVECYPLCSIDWYWNFKKIKGLNNKYRTYFPCIQQLKKCINLILYFCS